MAGTNDFLNREHRTIEKNRLKAEVSTQNLISLERSQKLDLLIHLIANLRQSLVLCGPQGIGKTTMLDALENRSDDSWLICPILADDQLSYERTQDAILHSLQKDHSGLAGKELTEIFRYLEVHHQKIVLSIDDAGSMVPGLITALCQLAAANPILRIVFALTPDELHIKINTDKVIDDCHFIDIPALTELQCGEFLKNLSRKPDISVSYNAVNSAMISKLYLETHGIPGKIVARASNSSVINSSNGNGWIYSYIGIALIIVVGLSFLLWNNAPEKTVNNKTQYIADIDISEPVFNQASNSKNDLRIIAINNFPEDEGVSVQKKAVFQEQFRQENEEKSEQKTAAEQGNAMDGKNQITNSLASNNVDFPVSVVPSTEMISTEQFTSVAPESDVERIISKPVEAAIQLHSDQRILFDQPLPTERVKLDHTVESEESYQDIIIPEHERLIIETGQEKSDTVFNQDNQQPVQETTQSEIRQKIKKPMPDIKVSIAKKDTKKPIVESDDLTWVMGQSRKHFTLQIMILSKKKSLTKFLQKYADITAIRYFKSRKKGEERYVLLYGVFTTSKQAAEAMKSLPLELRKSWVRRFSMLHKQINATL